MAMICAYSVSRACWMIRLRWLTALKWGSGNKKNSFSSWPCASRQGGVRHIGLGAKAALRSQAAGERCTGPDSAGRGRIARGRA